MEIRARPYGSYFYIRKRQEKDGANVTEAIITGAVAIAVCMINNYFQQRRSEAQNDKTMALIDY